MNLSDFKIKKKVVIPAKTLATHHHEESDLNQQKKSRKRRLKLPETDVQKIFEGILQEASRDETIYKTLCSIINFANKEIVKLIVEREDCFLAEKTQPDEDSEPFGRRV